ncbi:hypothetical protein ALQ93_04092 [Pseudomonas syringae pv. pisi]|nr:hypothetical protein ALQ93_04092 [Pseudomonas syringae pv. pisi]RMU67489.1 hypothetical protein ALP24_00240 [Pseudomonas syringae pv. aptata]RMU81483.1 Superfamily II DNA and RNA helicase [Pseudomonas savastanoi pv. phaseolicola]RML62837.1 hypothetical protein ALQ92_01577 [Pseudomonas syringae pv. pisi]RMM21677.1 hypothetical protein ALQ82_03556 [Pseudomonas syringae pv. pisi]
MFGNCFVPISLEILSCPTGFAPITRYTATLIPNRKPRVQRPCMKFRFLLWMLGLLMARASRNNPAFQQQLAGKDLTFQLQTADGKVARHFVVNDQRIRSASGTVAEPAFAIVFRDAAFGFDTLQAKNNQLAFMKGIQDKDIQIKGNPALVIWFQGLVKYLKPRKKTA